MLRYAQQCTLMRRGYILQMVYVRGTEGYQQLSIWANVALDSGRQSDEWPCRVLGAGGGMWCLGDYLPKMSWQRRRHCMAWGRASVLQVHVVQRSERALRRYCEAAAWWMCSCMARLPVGDRVTQAN